jgi:hypothetical protein
MSSEGNLDCALPFHHLRPIGFDHAPIVSFKKKGPRFQGPSLCLLIDVCC